MYDTLTLLLNQNLAKYWFFWLSWKWPCCRQILLQMIKKLILMNYSLLFMSSSGISSRLSSVEKSSLSFTLSSEQFQSHNHPKPIEIQVTNLDIHSGQHPTDPDLGNWDSGKDLAKTGQYQINLTPKNWQNNMLQIGTYVFCRSQLG